MWQQLENNWVNFFWLTGETPSTLAIIVNRIANINNPFVARGRPLCLDLRNQVSSALHDMDLI